MAHNFNTIEGTEVFNVNDAVQGSHAVTLEDVRDYVSPYKVYTALLTQSGTSAPTAVVLENTLGFEVIWGRESAGKYSAGGFTQDKTTVFFTRNPVDMSEKSFGYFAHEDSAVIIWSYNQSNALSDNILCDGDFYTKSLIEIRVYN